MLKQLSTFFKEPPQSKLPSTSVSGEAVLVGAQAQGITAAGGYASFTESSSREVQEITQSINDLALKFISNDMYTYAMNFDLEKEQRKITDYVSSDEFKKLKSDWSKFGVHELASADEQIKENHVGLYVGYDPQGLVTHLKVKSNFRLSKATLDFNIIAMRKEIEKIKEHNLTYLKDYEGLDREIKSLNETLKKTSDTKRPIALNAFNQKWTNQLTATLTCYADSNKRELQVTNRLGKNIFSATFYDSEFVLRGDSHVPVPPTTSEWVVNTLTDNAGLLFGIGLFITVEYMTNSLMKDNRLWKTTAPLRAPLYAYAGLQLERQLIPQAQEGQERNHSKKFSMY